MTFEESLRSSSDPNWKRTLTPIVWRRAISARSAGRFLIAAIRASSGSIGLIPEASIAASSMQAP